MKQNIIITALLLTVIGLGAKEALNYLSLPIVAFNQSGQCVYVEREGKRQFPCSCIPDKYIRDSVAGWSNKDGE